MRTLILTSCTGEKASKPANQLVSDDFCSGRKHLQSREKELKDFLMPAESLYTGQQHVRLMRGVGLIREEGKQVNLEFQILSAGYGLIPSDRKIAPYEATFQGMKKGELRHWAEQLDVAKDFAALMATKRDLSIILLGDSYLEACQINEKTDFASPTLLFCGKGAAKKLPHHKNLKVVTLSNPEAKRFSCGLVALKGEMAHRICSGLVLGKLTPKILTATKVDVLSVLENGKVAASKQNKTSDKKKPPAKKTVMRPNPQVDKVIQIPKSWWDKPHRKKLRYFIPEWDDLVDPDFDFITDTHSGGRGDWGNQVYAHQMYPEPNYDGLLMSRAVAEKSKAKRDRINDIGVHRMLRVPREFPIMGDCGAFDYIMEEVPPYTTDDVLDYYTRLDFDLGISVDHLIVSATEDQKLYRYNLTINNADELLKEHHKAKLKWEPIGAVQGWDPDSYAKAAGQYVKMGYKYIALGGMVRTTSREILQCVQKVREKVPADISIHVLGVARLDWMNSFAEAGVQSVDSASYLRQAWMRVNQSYTSFDGPYAALRIPEAGKSFRAKNMEAHPDLTESKILKMEQAALNAVRAYGSKKGSLEDALEALLEYDQFVTAERVDMRDAYVRTLTHRPWEKCGCAICQTWGVEVVIFRGNNRNRRRGFHNTYVFYRLLQKVLAGESIPFLTKDGTTNQLGLNLV